MVSGSGIFQHLASGRLRDHPKELSVFLLSRKVENCSKATIDTYDRRISQFLVFAKKPLTQIERSDVDLYLLSLREKKLSPHYVESCYRSLRAFFNWLVDEDMLPQSPMRNIKRPKTPKFTKEFLSEAQYLRLLAVCPIKDYQGIRNRAWLTLLWSTGARFSELANLKLGDLDWQQNRIRVFGKGAKERYVPFTQDAQKAVYKYLAVRPEQYLELWVTEERKPLKPTGLRKITRTLFERAEVKVKDLHHIFRRSWAMRNIRAGIPTKYIALVGGWSSINMLEHYVAAMTSEDAIGAKWV